MVQITIDNIDLEKFERAVYARKYEEAGQELITVLRRLRSGAEFINYPMDQAFIKSLYTRLASAITTLLCDPEFKISVDGYNVIIAHHSILSAIFAISGFENGDHVMRIVGSLTEDGKLNFSGQYNVLKAILAYCLDSSVDLDFRAIFSSNPQLWFPTWIGMAAHGINLLPAEEARRTELLKLYDVFNDLEMPDHLLSSVSDLYMHCSYSTWPDKHKVKLPLNAMMKKLVEKNVEIQTVVRKEKERPTIVVILERFASSHAMFRVYGNSVAQLRRKFNVHAIVGKNEIDEESEAIFDSVRKIQENNVKLAEVVEWVKELDPDIVYYPSIGMATWAIALSTVRLAPIQVMSPGHPATTYSEAMDYLVTESLWAPEHGCFSEKVITRSSDSVSFHVPRGTIFPKKSVNAHSPFRVAVPAMACKLSAPFMQSCRKIQEKTGCEFWFFPNMIGVSHWYTANRIRQIIPNAVVPMREDYNKFLEQLAQCDLYLDSYPFGGTNSVFDAMMIGLPILTLEGKEIFERTCGGFMREKGFVPEKFICKSAEEFEEQAISMIEYANFLSREDVQSVEEWCGRSTKWEPYTNFVPDFVGKDVDTFDEVFMRIYKEHQ